MSGKQKKSGTRLSKRDYEEELERLQVELVRMQQWITATGARVVVIFEGRDAAGKGGAIKRIAQYLNPRTARVVALPTPSERGAASGTSSATSNDFQQPGKSC